MSRLAAGLALGALLSATAMAQQEPTFHVDVPLVNVFVSVTDKAGAPIGGLTKTFTSGTSTWKVGSC